MDLNSIKVAENYLEAGDREAMSVALSNSYVRFEEEQPVVAARIAQALGRCQDDAARGLGVYLAIVVWLSFIQNTENKAQLVSETDFDNAQMFLKVDEEVRKQSPSACIDTDDIVAMHQPALAGFIRERLDETLRTFENEIDIDEADRVYGLILVEVLALSYAVEAPANSVEALRNLS